jgi:hypothetical protein
LVVQDPNQLDEAILHVNHLWINAVGWLKNNKGEIFANENF